MLKDQIGCAGPLELTSSSLQVRTWAQLSSKLRLLSKVRKQKCAAARRQSAEASKAVEAAMHLLGKLANDANDLVMMRRARSWSNFWSNFEDSSEDIQKEWIESATEVHRREIEKAAREAKRSFIQWQIKDAQLHNSKGMITWVKKAGAAPQQNDFVHNGQLALCNAQACAFRATQWGKQWMAT